MEVVVVEVVVVVGPEVVLVVVVGASVVVTIRQQLLHCQGWTQVFNFYENIWIRVYDITIHSGKAPFISKLTLWKTDPGPQVWTTPLPRLQLTKSVHRLGIAWTPLPLQDTVSPLIPARKNVKVRNTIFFMWKFTKNESLKLRV